MAYFEIKPIGWVTNTSYPEERQKTSREDRQRFFSQVRAEITLRPELIPGLEGLREGAYLWVLYWMDQLSDEERGMLQAHPRGDRSLPLQGVFSLRSPMRPNPIGLTRVRLLGRRDNWLLVQGLDALAGTPIVDLKTWSEESDCREMIRLEPARRAASAKSGEE